MNQNDLDLIRNEFEAKLANANLDHMQTAAAIGSYAERFTGVDARIDAVDYRLDSLSGEIDRRFDAVDQRFDLLQADMNRRFEAIDRRFEAIDRRFDTTDAALKDLRDKLDLRFGWQTAATTIVGVLVLFGDPLRSIIGV